MFPGKRSNRTVNQLARGKGSKRRGKREVKRVEGN